MRFLLKFIVLSSNVGRVGQYVCCVGMRKSQNVCAHPSDSICGIRSHEMPFPIITAHTENGL